MRDLSSKEMRKRGCAFCADSKVTRKLKNHKNSKYYAKVRMCVHDECPYHELDKHETYAEYMDSVKPLQFESLKGFEY